MSRTDQHAPYFTRLLEPGAVIAAHDHSRGDCDLIPIEDWIKHPPAWGTVTCRWHVRYEYDITHPSCGCALCTNQVDRKRKNRRERRAGRWDTINGYLEYLEDTDDDEDELLDDVTPPEELEEDQEDAGR